MSMMTTIKAVTVAVVILVIAACSAAAAGNKFDSEITGKPGTLLPGHGQQDQCSVYALALTSAMSAKGIKATWVAIKWQGIELGHSFVVFQRDGKLWAIDNEMAKPVRVSGKTDLEIAKRLYSLRSNRPVEAVCAPMMGFTAMSPTAIEALLQ